MSRTRELAEFATAYDSGNPLGMRNRIINGDMRVAQRGTSAVSTDGAYPVDRWMLSNTDVGNFNARQDTDTPLGQGFRSSIKWTCNTGSATTGSQSVRTTLEVQDSTDVLDWPGSAGKSVTLSFWIKGSQSGTITTSVRESSASACFCNLTEVTTSWVQKSITIPAPTIGNWSTTANAGGVVVIFAFANHSTANTTSADVWAPSNAISLTSQTNWTGITGAEIYITGVQLEAGSVATPFERRPFGTELALCQRYYQRLVALTGNRPIGNGLARAFSATGALITLSLTTTMRSAPSSVDTTGTPSNYNLDDPTVANFNLTAIGLDTASPDAVRLILTTASGLNAFRTYIFRAASGTTDTFVGFSAEL